MKRVAALAPGMPVEIKMDGEPSPPPGLLRLEIECSEARLDIRLSMKREDGFAGLLRTTIDKPVSTRDAKEEVDGEKWHFFRETFLPAYRHVVTKYVQRDRFAARDC